jgi:hypothetical protein
MWRRHTTEKHPTPITVLPSTPPEAPLPAAAGAAEEREEGEMDEINMFDELNHNIGELSVFNEKDDASLFHSFFHT